MQEEKYERLYYIHSALDQRPKTINRSGAVKGLGIIAAELENRAAWIAPNTHESIRAHAIDPDFQSGEQSYALRICNNEIELRGKLEAALQMAGVSSRSNLNNDGIVKVNGVVIELSQGNCTIIVNAQGKDELSAYIRTPCQNACPPSLPLNKPAIV